MRGGIIGVWSETWREIWSKLAEYPEYGNDLFSDLYREIVPAPIPPQEPPPAQELTDDGELVCSEDIEAQNTYNSARQTYTQNRAQYEEAIRNLRTDQSSGKIKTCIQKQMNLLEAIGQECPGVAGNTLGHICNQVGTWPHEAVKDSMKNLYQFSCNYPGIRHRGTAANQLRGIEMRDMVAVSVVLAGFSPYLTNLLDFNRIFHGS
jgi:hypothetical protein